MRYKDRSCRRCSLTINIMVDFSNYPFPTYIPNKIIAGICASLVFISFLAWLVQSIQNHFQPRRLLALVLVAHLAIVSELIVRATANIREHDSKAIYTMMTIFYTIGHRAMIISNFTFLIGFYESKSRLSRVIFLGITVGILVADLLMTPVGILSFHSNHIHLSFLFRQMSTAMICLIDSLFYPIWFWTRTLRIMSYEAIIVLTVSSVNSLLIALFLLVMSVPKYYIVINDDEEWFYFFQILPMMILLLTWSVLHPKRSFRFRNRLTVGKENEEEKKTTYTF